MTDIQIHIVAIVGIIPRSVHGRRGRCHDDNDPRLNKRETGGRDQRTNGLDPTAGATTTATAGAGTAKEPRIKFALCPFTSSGSPGVK